MRIYLRKKLEAVLQLPLYEADNSDRVSSRSAICYHSSNSINIAILIIWLIETNKFIILCRSKQTSQHTDCWKMTDPVFALWLKVNWNTRINLTRASNYYISVVLNFTLFTTFLILSFKKINYKNVYGNCIVILILQIDLFIYTTKFIFCFPFSPSLTTLPPTLPLPPK